MTLWHTIGEQLRRPEGKAGRALGWAMCLLNATPNSLAVEALAIKATDDVLELGFGPGDAIARMLPQTSHGSIIGIDASPTMLAQATRRNREAIQNGRVKLILGQGISVPLADASVDKILAVNVAYFWEHPAAELSEMLRVLRPGGTIAIYVTHAESMKEWKFADHATHRLYTEDGLRVVLLEAGFNPAHLSVTRLSLPLGVQGMLAVAEKSPDPSSHHVH